jgi:hypothetical protein
MPPRSPYARKNVQSVPGPTSASDLVRGVALQIARKYLFVPATTKALVYFVIVAVLSFLAGHAPLPSNWYFNQVTLASSPCISHRLHCRSTIFLINSA